VRGNSRPCDNVSVCVDACGRAAGAFFMADCEYTEFEQFNEDAPDLCINYKEVLALLPAVKKWFQFFANKVLHVCSDNQCAVKIINKGTCKNPMVMEVLRTIFWYSVIFNFRIKCHYLPGVRNCLADAVSRLHEKYGILRYDNLLTKWYQTNAFNVYTCLDKNVLQVC